MGRLIFLVFVSAFVATLMIPSTPGKDATSPESSRSDGRDLSVKADVAEKPDPVSINNAAYGETVLTRDGSGQFYTDVAVNGQSLPFLIDTGADMVAITISDARRLGLFIEPHKFYPVGSGAGGQIKGQVVHLDRLRVAGHEIEGVEAVVIDGLETNLLGQSVLRRFAKVELSGDQMRIR